MAQRQINIRIEESEFDVLAAEAFVEGVAPPDLLRPLIEQHVAELESDPDTMEALRGKQARDRRKAAKKGAAVSSLAAAKKKRAGRRDA